MKIPDKLRATEYEFWSIVENPDKFEKTEVEYAADLPSSKYGSAFTIDVSKDKLASHSFNLAKINYAHNSLF